jgi:hypothetical protein
MIMVGAAILLVSRVWLAEWVRRPVVLNAPLTQLVDSWRPHLQTGDVILADTAWLGGNLRLLLPGHAVMTPQEPGLGLPRDTHSRGWIVWDRTRSPTPPDSLIAMLQELHAGIDTNLGAVTLEAPLRHFKQRTMKLAALPFRSVNETKP